MSEAQREAWQKYMTEKQVSEMTGICLSTLRNWRVIGKGPVYLKPGGVLVRYRLSDVQTFMEGREATGGEAA